MKSSKRNLLQGVMIEIPEIRFFAIFLSLVLLFSLKLHRMIAWNNGVVEVELTKKTFGAPKLCQKLSCFFATFSSLHH